VARVLHNRQGKASSAVFGTITSSDVNTRPTGEKPPSSIASAVKSKPHKNPKATPNTALDVKHTIASKLRKSRKHGPIHPLPHKPPRCSAY
jgi:hypothetical protein